MLTSMVVHGRRSHPVCLKGEDLDFGPKVDRGVASCSWAPS